MIRFLGAIVAALMVLTACGATGTRDVDEQAWQDALAAQGVEPANWSDYRTNVEGGVCRDDADTLAIYLTLQGVDPAVVRTDIEYGCPDHLDVFHEARDQADDAQNTADRLCNTPRNQLSAEDQQARDAICLG